VQEIAASEFPFVEALPKREARRVRTALDVLAEWRAATKLHGSLVPRPLVAKVLNVSQERVRQYIVEGRLATVAVEGHEYVTEGSLNDLALTERKAGRPIKPLGFVGKIMAAADHFDSETSK
jgi:hypothetical protein